jgi:hypothetical protein
MFLVFSLVWSPGNNKRIAPLPFFYGRRKKRLILVIDYDQIEGLIVKYAVVLIEELDGPATVRSACDRRT